MATTADDSGSTNYYNLPNLSDKNVIITGGNSGLGFKSAVELAKQGAEVTITCRSDTKGQKAIDDLKKELTTCESDNKVSYDVCDLNNLKSIQTFVKNYTKSHNKVDIFIANAGVSTVIVEGGQHKLTEPDGQEVLMQANYLGHFALLYGLYSLLLQSDAPRILSCNTAFWVTEWKAQPLDLQDFNWSKRAADGKYDVQAAYMQSRLAQQLMTFQLNQKFSEEDNMADKAYAAVCMSPGLVQRPNQDTTNDNLPILQYLRKSVEEGVRTHLLAATGPEIKPNDFLEPHRFIFFGSPVTHTLNGAKKAGDSDAAQKLWDYSKQIVDDAWSK